MQEIRPVRNPKTGKQVYTDEGEALFTFNATAANRALELIGRHVTYETSSSTTTDGEERPLPTGIVERVLLSDDRIRLQVDGSSIQLSDLVEITTRNSDIVQQPNSQSVTDPSQTTKTTRSRSL